MTYYPHIMTHHHDDLSSTSYSNALISMTILTNLVILQHKLSIVNLSKLKRGSAVVVQRCQVCARSEQKYSHHPHHPHHHHLCLPHPPHRHMIDPPEEKSDNGNMVGAGGKVERSVPQLVLIIIIIMRSMMIMMIIIIMIIMMRMIMIIMIMLKTRMMMILIIMTISVMMMIIIDKIINKVFTF